jgi:NADPH:quinone reductase-like Zn-dependent oxidoreductase
MTDQAELAADHLTTTATPAVRLSRFGDLEVIEVTDAAAPAPAADEVLVRVHAASVNPVDWKIASGSYPRVTADDLPIILGRDLAGTVEQAGETGVAEGARVMAFIGQDRGGQAGLVPVKMSELVMMPEGLAFDAAAGAGLASMTAWQGLFDQGGLQAGQRVLIHGGGGGVGHMAVQLARWKGATVYATASAHDLDFVRDLGAERAIDYKEERFEEIATDMDVVFDTQGGETQKRSFGVLRSGGIVVTTLEPDEEAATAAGVRISPRWHAEPKPDQLGEVARLLASGELRVAIDRSFPLAQAREAYRYTKEEHPRGKVVLLID